MTRQEQVSAWVASVIESPDSALVALRAELARGTRADRITRLSSVIADGLGITPTEALERAISHN